MYVIAHAELIGLYVFIVSMFFAAGAMACYCAVGWQVRTHIQGRQFAEIRAARAEAFNEVLIAEGKQYKAMLAAAGVSLWTEVEDHDHKGGDHA